MRWENHRQSDNMEDRRGGGGGMGGGGKLGLGTMVVLGIIGYALGIDPRVLIGGAEMLSGGGGPAPQVQPGTKPSDETGRFVSSVLAQTEDVWRQIYPQQTGKAYRDPKLVLFSGGTRSGCGAAQQAMGPFYCPTDQTVYLDMGFFEDMRKRFGVKGDFAVAYVIAHEVGHHVQNVVGLLGQVQQAQRSVDERTMNAYQVRVELQADCLAGVWAHHAEKRFRILQEGDVEEAMNAAAAVGDDNIQKKTQGRVVPESFTHGTSEQRMRWFTTGIRSGDMGTCDTFKAQRI